MEQRRVLRAGAVVVTVTSLASTAALAQGPVDIKPRFNIDNNTRRRREDVISFQEAFQPVPPADPEIVAVVTMVTVMVATFIWWWRKVQQRREA